MMAPNLKIHSFQLFFESMLIALFQNLQEATGLNICFDNIKENWLSCFIILAVLEQTKCRILTILKQLTIIKTHLIVEFENIILFLGFAYLSETIAAARTSLQE